MTSKKMSGRNIIFLSDDENDTMDDLFFVKIEPDIMQKTLQNNNTGLNDSLCLNKMTREDNSTLLNLRKTKAMDPLSEQNNLPNENMGNSKTNNLQKPFTIRVRSEFSEKNMMQNCLLNKEDDKVSDKAYREVLITPTSKMNVQKKNAPLLLLRKIAVPRKKLKFLTQSIKTADNSLNNNTPSKIGNHGLKEKPMNKLEVNEDNCEKCNSIEKEPVNLRSFHCAYCGFKTSDKDTLRTHMHRHVGNPYKCLKCKFTTTRPVHMKEHVKKHTGESLKCPQCSFKTIYQRSLNFHMLKHNETPEHTCEICKAQFYRPQYLKRHMRRHSQEFRLECDYCKKEFFRKIHLINHINRHTGNKPFKCEICQNGFVQMYHLQRHQLIHFKEKKFSCDLCPEKFDRLYSLKRHVKATHTGEKLFKCKICELKFIRPEHLKKHTAEHIKLSKKVKNKRVYKCKFCKFTALSAFAFNEHINKHVDSNLKICNECGNSFERKKNLKLHWDKKHRDLLS